MPAAQFKITQEQYTALLARVTAVESMESRILALEASRAAPSAAPVKAKRAKKERDPDAPARAPTAWILFTSRVRALLKDHGFSTGVEVQQFASSLREANSDLSSWTDAQILSSRSSWTRPEVSKMAAAGKTKRNKSSASDAGSVASAPVVESKPAKVVLSDEEKKAARNEKARLARAAKKAAAAAAPVEAPAAPVAAPVVAAPASVAAPVASAGAGGASEYKSIVIKGKRYLVHRETNGAYHRETDGSVGEWAGLYNVASNSIDDSVAEPDCDDDGSCVGSDEE